MSASEKLKVLEQAMWDDNGPREDSLGVYLLALPQIVAVVEAAEITSVWSQGEGWTQEEVSNMPPYDRLQAALTALDEALK